MRLDRFLANMGFGTRKEVKKLVKAGAVYVNEKITKASELHINPETDEVAVNGEIVFYRPFIYLMLHKPQGVISATEDVSEKTVLDLLTAKDASFELFPVGRLDKDTEGLILLTNNGKLAHELLAPKKHVEKTYYVKVEGVVTEDDVGRFSKGVVLDDGYTTKPSRLLILKSEAISEVELTITEGKFHQVKRMFAAVNKTVVYLKRLSMGPLKLDESLQLGQYRELTEAEVALLTSEQQRRSF